MSAADQHLRVVIGNVTSMPVDHLMPRTFSHVSISAVCTLLDIYSLTEQRYGSVYIYLFILLEGHVDWEPGNRKVKCESERSIE
jgi:hypothetical protein